jgi:hypothetical protein
MPALRETRRGMRLPVPEQPATRLTYAGAGEKPIRCRDTLVKPVSSFKSKCGTHSIVVELCYKDRNYFGLVQRYSVDLGDRGSPACREQCLPAPRLAGNICAAYLLPTAIEPERVSPSSISKLSRGDSSIPIHRAENHQGELYCSPSILLADILVSAWYYQATCRRDCSRGIWPAHSRAIGLAWRMVLDWAASFSPGSNPSQWPILPAATL